MNEELVQNGVMNEELVQSGVMNEELVQNSVLNGEFVQNGVMNQKFVKNFVMNAKIDPKVVMELSIFYTGGWNSFQPISQKLLEEFIDENEPWLLIGIPSRDLFLVTEYLERHSASSDQHMKKLMSRRKALHVMMQCYMRQHFADRHSASWRESTRMKFMKYVIREMADTQMECSKMRSESSGYMWKTTVLFF